MRNQVESALLAAGAGEKRLGVAVSGGRDSMALLHLLGSIVEKSRLVCLHFEHGIRAEASLRDRDFVRETAASLGIAFVSGEADVPAEAAKTGENLEAAARRLRYAFFAEASRSYALDFVLTAHHAADRAEGMLLNLLRGTGLSGLCALTLRRAPNLLRPMLRVTREEIDAYLEANAIAFLEDETNCDLSYSRNYLRAEVTPRFSRLNPRWEDAFSRTAELLQEDEALLSSLARAEAARLLVDVPGGIELSCEALLALCPSLSRRVVREAAARVSGRENLEMSHIEAILALAKTGCGKFLLEGRLFCRSSCNTLFFGESEDAPAPFSAPATDGLVLPDGAVLKITPAKAPEAFPAPASMAFYVDGEAIEGALVRTRMPGDRFYPLGAPGEKKLADWLIDKKIPAHRRNWLLLLAKEENVLAVFGEAICETAKICDKTRQIFRIEICKKGEN